MLFSYYAKVLSRAYKDTLTFMGWDKELRSIARSIFLWGILLFVIYYYNAAHLQENISSTIEGLLAAIILLVFAFLFHLIAAPAKIFDEQVRRIDSLTRRRIGKLELKQRYEALDIAHKNGKDVAAKYEYYHLAMTDDDLVAWVDDTVKIMELNNVPPSDIFDFKNPHNDDTVEYRLNWHLGTLRQLIKQYMDEYERP